MMKFTRSTQNRAVFLALMADPEKDTKRLDQGLRAYSVLMQTHYAHTGTSQRMESLETVISRGVKITAEQAKAHWEKLYKHSEHSCCHVYWSGHCINLYGGGSCDVRTKFSLRFLLKIGFSFTFHFFFALNEVWNASP